MDKSSDAVATSGYKPHNWQLYPSASLNNGMGVLRDARYLVRWSFPSEIYAITAQKEYEDGDKDVFYGPRELEAAGIDASIYQSGVPSILTKDWNGHPAGSLAVNYVGGWMIEVK